MNYLQRGGVVCRSEKQNAHIDTQQFIVVLGRRMIILTLKNYHPEETRLFQSGFGNPPSAPSPHLIRTAGASLTVAYFWFSAQTNLAKLAISTPHSCAYLSYPRTVVRRSKAITIYKLRDHETNDEFLEFDEEIIFQTACLDCLNIKSCIK